MLNQTPFHPRTSALCTSFRWKEWSGHAAVCTFDAHSEREYFAVRHGVSMLDVSPLYKYELRGADGARLLSRLFTRDITRLGVNRVTYGCLVDPLGDVLDDGTVSRLDDHHWRLTSSEPWLAWLRKHANRLDVTIDDSSRELAALAVQGPNARALVQEVTDVDLDRMRFFRVRAGQIAGHPGWISRTGYTGDLGYELWVRPDAALPLWDALAAAGPRHGLQPIGLDALDVVRLEAGFVLQGVDYVSARNAAIPARRSSPHEVGLG
ncbi:MAG: aminomethyltransferase, partial [Myxococcota bacterium]